MNESTSRMTDGKPSTTPRTIFFACGLPSISPAASCTWIAWHGRLGDSNIEPIGAMGRYHMADAARPSTDIQAARSC